MKFLHVSDLHIGARPYNCNLEADMRYVFEQIYAKVREIQPDVFIVAGDIYDKSVPTIDAIALFNEFLTKLIECGPQMTIMMISGNHDNSIRIDYLSDILTDKHIYMVGKAPSKPDEYLEKVILHDAYGPVNFYLMPFVKPSMVKDVVGLAPNGNQLSYNESIQRLIAREEVNQSERNVLVSHQLYLPTGKKAEELERSEYESKTVGNIDSVDGHVLKTFDYAALGHIHKPMMVNEYCYRYCGTMMPLSFDEENQTKGILAVDMQAKGTVTVEVLPLKPLHNFKTFKGQYYDLLKTKSDDYVRVILTDEADLDVIDMQDRLRSCFPNLLEIERSATRQANYHLNYQKEREKSEFELCKDFLGNLNDEEEKLLKTIINDVKGVN